MGRTTRESAWFSETAFVPPLSSPIAYPVFLPAGYKYRARSMEFSSFVSPPPPAMARFSRTVYALFLFSAVLARPLTLATGSQAETLTNHTGQVPARVLCFLFMSEARNRALILIQVSPSQSTLYQIIHPTSRRSWSVWLRGLVFRPSRRHSLFSIWGWGQLQPGITIPLSSVADIHEWKWVKITNTANGKSTYGKTRDSCPGGSSSKPVI